ncbi:MAG: DNA-directed RNA polymerase subunit D [Nitrososphaerota archaeon]
MSNKVKIAGEGENWLRVELVDMPLSVGNALRRIIINEVPTMAVEEVLVIENTSVLANEVLAHRISLIPFVTDIDNYVLPEKCDCGSALGCDKCSVRFSLRRTSKEEVETVYAADLLRESGSEKVAPISGDFQIVKLAPGQSVELELYVRLGKGKKHAKWQSGIATLYEEDGRRMIYVESFGFLPPRRMVLEATKIFEEMVAELKENIAKVVTGGEDKTG